MSKNKIYQPGWRVRKAYWTATVVMSSYFWLFLKRKIFGKNYYEKRIFKLHVKNAERVKTAILELKGLFIKIGQLLHIHSAKQLPKTILGTDVIYIGLIIERFPDLHRLDFMRCIQLD